MSIPAINNAFHNLSKLTDEMNTLLYNNLLQ